MQKAPEFLEDDWTIGQKVMITVGPFRGFEGVIYLIDREKRIVRVKIIIIGRPTPVELPFSYMQPISGTET